MTWLTLKMSTKTTTGNGNLFVFTAGAQRDGESTRDQA